MNFPWLTRRVLGWALYDVASSTYVALVPTFFGLYFVTNVSAGSSGSGYWGLAAAVSVGLTGLLAPLAGAYADRTARWIVVLAVATVLCVIGTLVLPLASAHGALAAAAAFVCAQVGYALATSLYDSYVVDVAPARYRGQVSGFGWAVGLVGGMSAVLIAIWMMRGIPAGEQIVRLGAVFVMTGLIFGVLALPGVGGVRGLRVPAAPPMRKGALVDSARGVVSTLLAWRAHGPVIQVLAAFFLINDVLVTIQFFIVIVLSARFGLTVEGMLWLALLFSAIAIPATLLAGHAADQRGGRPVLVAMCLALGAAIVLLAVGTGNWIPVAVVVLLGLVFAPIQASFRALYASLIPSNRAAEMFGFNVIAGRLSAAIGPLVFGAVAAWLGGNAVALIVLLLPLATGVMLLLTADLSDRYDRRPGDSRELAETVQRG
ncbi:MAG: D-galactonate transporter [Burkholderiaceae bacterium]|jgi:UMF1 family MFS transporter|nr:D-galactonate transporter [Burkholderiaceae bacterium]